ncbi:MAG: DUF389 domain-containing protein [Citromicrobium sp.]|nr:MAG: DUF389 domain-containing protein [Citromicrobium sp.]
MTAPDSAADNSPLHWPSTESIDEALAREEESGRKPPKWVHSGVGRAIVPIRRWWLDHVIEDVDYKGTIAKIAGESTTTPRYIFMTMMSAGIAILGMLLASPAVVIGAMLLSPLMSPILGAGFALASGKIKWLRLSVSALFVGSGVAIAFCALIVLLSPVQTITPEIASRTQPNLFDLLIAFFSSLAGSYAMIRGRDGTIVGVAIATALMPPLAAVGFGLATLNWTVFGGALMLYVTNFLTIALTAAIMARFYGFRTDLSVRQGWFQSFGIILVFIALAVPLGLSLRQFAFEANAQTIVKTAIAEEFPERARVSEPEFDWDADPLRITGSVFTPQFDVAANDKIARALEEQLERPVSVSIEQYLVGTDPGAAEQAQLAQARAASEAASDAARINALVDRLAIVCGVEREQVTVDRTNRRAVVQARNMPGITLSGWYTLERQIGADAEGWSVELRPPLLPLPAVPVEGGEIGEAAQRAVATIAWAATRRGLPVRLSGDGEALDTLAETLREAGIRVSINDNGNANRIEADWLTQAD